MRLALLAILLAGCGYRLGRPPAVESLSLGEVSVQSAQPGLREAIARAVAEEGAKRVVLGRGPVLSTTVMEVSSRALSPGGELRQAELVLRFDLEGARCVELRGQRTFSGGVDPLTVLAAREAAFAALAEELVREGLGRLLAGPEASECP